MILSNFLFSFNSFNGTILLLIEIKLLALSAFVTLIFCKFSRRSKYTRLQMIIMWMEMTTNYSELKTSYLETKTGLMETKTT